MKNPLDQEPTASLVIEYDQVAGDQELRFKQWQSEIRAGVSEFEGYLRTDVFLPIQGVQDKWHIVVHFDTPANLSRWLDSDIRHQLINLGKRDFGAYQYQVRTGLEAWFTHPKHSSDARITPPAWKQILAVLFGLYPTVMLEMLLFSHFHLMESWSFAFRMFVNNLVSCFILTLAVMPLVTGLLNFWLKSAAIKINAIGSVLILTGYGLMISIFHFFS